ncbi:hypothetical protein SY88_11740 [Clostridiales bacterium PH28_bin88]|nr:hypothetical protein SY88_11740 [Clostridiales bacterium PH28_bin88]
MKSHKKLIALIVALTFVLSLAVPMTAGAATIQENAATKLNAMGIVEGYPDGTFGLDKNITRAEFAKVAIVTAGLKEAADLMKNTPSQFSDVKTGEWYTGWINLAAAKGFVKGDPAGTFRPNDKISYAEVLTVVLRILGYNDNLPGSWPVDYLAKAVELGITDDLSFDAKAPSVRGDVFAIVDATLDQNWVKYDKDTDSFVDGKTPAEKLVVKNYKGSVIDDAFVTGWTVSNGEYTISYVGGSKKAAKTVTFAGASNIDGLKNKFVDFVLNKDGEVAVATVQDFTVVKDTEQDKSNSDYATATLEGTGAFVSGTNSGFKVKNDDKTYTVATNAILSGSLGTLTVSGSTYSYALEAPSITLQFNKDNQVYYIGLGSPGTQPGIVKSVNTTTKRITVVSGTTNANLANFNTDASDDETVYKIFKGGKEVGFDAIQAGDTISISPNTAEGLDYKVTIGGKKVEGTLESMEYDSDSAWRIKVTGTKYELATSNGTAQRTIVSLDGGETYKSNASMTADLESLLGKAVTLTLNSNGDVEFVKGNTGAASKQYGVIRGRDLVYKGGAAYDILANVKLLLGDGSKVTYTVNADSNIKTVGGTVYDGDDVAAVAEIVKGYFVKYDLTSDGAIDNLEILDANTSDGNVGGYDTDNKRVKLNGTFYNVTDSTVIFKNVASDPKVSNWTELKTYGANAYYYFKADGVDLQYLVLSGNPAAAAKFAVVQEKGRDADGYYLKLNVNGTVSRYDADDVDETAGYTNSAYKSFVTFQASGTDLTSVTKIDVSNTVYTVEEINYSSKAVKIGGEWYFVNSDTQLYDVTGTPKTIAFDEIFEGNKVNSLTPIDKGDGSEMSDTNNILRYLIIKN